MSRRLVPPIIAGLGAILTLAASIAPANAYDALYAFGDSLSDAGNVYALTLHLEPISPPYAAGRFTNGKIWLQDLAATLGLPRARPELLGGTDFAVGGAETGTTAVHTANFIDLPGQFAAFTAKTPTPRPNALYAIWIGSNDLFDILAAPNLTPGQREAVARQAIANIATFIGAVAAAGANHVVVLDAPDLGKTPQIRELGPAAQSAAGALAAYFDRALASDLTTLNLALGLDLHIVDTFTVIDQAVADPSAYGFTNVVDPCWTGGFTSRNGKVCAISRDIEDNHLFWDHIHPTARGHALLAGVVAQALTGTAMTVDGSP
jgi:phospholipase/lecithinase/hemolysin